MRAWELASKLQQQSYHCVMASYRDNLILLEMFEEKKNFGVKTVITISHCLVSR